MFLNDSLIDFYHCYLLDRLPPDIGDRSYIFSTFFFKRFAGREVRGSDDSMFDRVRRWTGAVNLFTKDFPTTFFMSRCSLHWYLAVICYPGDLKMSHQTRGNSPIDLTTVCALLVRYSRISACLTIAMI